MRPCPGVHIRLPDGMISFTVHYPFLLHVVDYAGSPKWPMPGVHGVIHAHDCKEFLTIIVETNPDFVDTIPSSSCVECMKVDPSQDLSGLSAPAKHLRQIFQHLRQLLQQACDDMYHLTPVNDVYLKHRKKKANGDETYKWRSGWRQAQDVERPAAACIGNAHPVLTCMCFGWAGHNNVKPLLAKVVLKNYACSRMATRARGKREG